MSSADCTWIDDYLAGDLPVDWNPLFEQHLLQCASCREEVEAWNTLRGMLAQAAEELEQPPEALSQRIAESLKRQPQPPAEQPRARLLPAAAAVCLLVGALLYAIPQQDELPLRPGEQSIAQKVAPKPDVTVALPDDLIGVPVDVGDPDVTVVWMYPTFQPEKREAP